MFRPRKTSRSAALLAALLGIALNALWPLLAQAKPAYVGLPQTICTEQGLVNPAQGDTQAPVGTVGCKHCCLCMLGGDRTHALPPSFAPVPVASAPVAERPRAAPAPALHSGPVTPAHPRAPPFSI